MSDIEVTYVAGRQVYEINQGEYQNMLSLAELEAIIKNAKVEHPWLIERVKEWLQ